MAATSATPIHSTAVSSQEASGILSRLSGAFIEGRRQRAEQFVISHLQSFDTGMLLKLGYSARDIAQIRSGNFVKRG